MKLSTRSAFRSTYSDPINRTHRTRNRVGAVVAVAAVVLTGASFLTSASATTSSGIFAVQAKDSAGHESSAGLTAELTDPGTSPEGSDGSENPTTAAQFTLRGVSTNYFTRKSNTAGSEQPSIVIPGFNLDGSSLSTARDWSIVISKSDEPFGYSAVYKDGLPGWAQITDAGDKFIISNRDSSMRLGGATKNLAITQLEFNYTPPTYSAGQTVGEPSMASGSVSNMNLKVSTADTRAFSYGRWTTTFDISALRGQLANSNGELSLNSSATGFTLTKNSNTSYTLSYTGSDQNRYIKGVDAVVQGSEDTTTGYTVVQGVLVLAPGSSSTNQVSNADGTVTVELTQNSRTLSARYVKLPSASTPWSIDLDLSKLVAIDRTKTPLVYNNQFSLTQKSGDVYTLSYNGKGSPTVGGTGSAGQVDIQLPWS